MPRVKIHLEPRVNIYFRVPKEKYDKLLVRYKDLGIPTLNKYLERLIDEDLIYSELELKKKLLTTDKKKD